MVVAWTKGYSERKEKEDPNNVLVRNKAIMNIMWLKREKKKKSFK